MPKQLIALFATGLHLGRAPKAPGTFGTLLGIPLAILFFRLGNLGYMAATMVFIVFASAIADLYEREVRSHDNSEIVIDEVAGFLVTMTWLPQTWQAYLGGFILFRLLDIAKPFPISYIDEKVKGGIGVVADDIVAGLIANVILQFVYTYTSWLGVQLI